MGCETSKMESTVIDQAEKAKQMAVLQERLAAWQETAETGAGRTEPGQREITEVSSSLVSKHIAQLAYNETNSKLDSALKTLAANNEDRALKRQVTASQAAISVATTHQEEAEKKISLSVKGLQSAINIPLISKEEICEAVNSTARCQNKVKERVEAREKRKEGTATAPSSAPRTGGRAGGGSAGAGIVIGRNTKDNLDGIGRSSQ